MLIPTHKLAQNEAISLNRPAEIMRFTLIYDGPLPAQTAHDGRIERKHDIRLQFHDQLKDLWQTRPTLTDEYHAWILSESYRKKGESVPNDQTLSGNPATGPARTASPAQIIEPQNIGQNRFVSLIRDEMSMICELDILFLRKEPKGHLVNHAGDLDNRIKVLFDALRVPLSDSELPSTAVLPDPFFCLLQDDRLITRVSVTSERLLEGSAPTSNSHVRLIVNVITRATNLTWMNMGLSD